MEATQACGYDIPGLSPALKEWVLLCQQQQDNQRIALQQQMDNQRMAWARRRQRAWEKEMEELEQSPTPTISASKSPPMTVPGPSKTAPAPTESKAAKPVQEAAKPAQETAKPAQETAKPAQGVARPTKEAAKPALGRGQFGHTGKEAVKVSGKCKVIVLRPSQAVYQSCRVDLSKSVKTLLIQSKLLIVIEKCQAIVLQPSNLVVNCQDPKSATVKALIHCSVPIEAALKLSTDCLLNQLSKAAPKLSVKPFLNWQVIAKVSDVSIIGPSCSGHNKLYHPVKSTPESGHSPVPLPDQPPDTDPGKKSCHKSTWFRPAPDPDPPLDPDPDPDPVPSQKDDRGKGKE